MNYAEFTETMVEYKETHKIPEAGQKQEEEENEISDKVIEFISKYYMIILIPIIVICSGLMIYLDKKDDL